MINVVDRISTYPGRVKLTRADGSVEYVTWERADEPTVEGTPINKALFDSIKADIGLDRNVTVYVSKSGSDTLGDGTSSNPYLTIMKAVNSIPKNLNGKTANINIGAGAYSETVVLEYFVAGVIRIGGNANAGVTITGLDIRNCTVLIDSIALTVGSVGIYIGAKGTLYTASGTVTVTGAAYGITLRYGAVLDVSSTLTINNTTERALQVQFGSTASVSTLQGSGNKVGIYAYNSTVYVSKSTISATTPSVNDNATILTRG